MCDSVRRRRPICFNDVNFFSAATAICFCSSRSSSVAPSEAARRPRVRRMVGRFCSGLEDGVNGGHTFGVAGGSLCANVPTRLPARLPVSLPADEHKNSRLLPGRSCPTPSASVPTKAHPHYSPSPLTCESSTTGTWGPTPRSSCLPASASRRCCQALHLRFSHVV